MSLSNRLAWVVCAAAFTASSLAVAGEKGVVVFVHPTDQSKGFAEEVSDFKESGASDSKNRLKITLKSEAEIDVLFTDRESLVDASVALSGGRALDLSRCTSVEEVSYVNNDWLYNSGIHLLSVRCDSLGLLERLGRNGKPVVTIATKDYEMIDLAKKPVVKMTSSSRKWVGESRAKHP